MLDDLIDILRLHKEHSEILKDISAFLETIDKTSADSIEVVHDIAERLANLHNNLSKHVHFEEQEILPMIASYAGEILRRGVLLEHEEILASLSELVEEARNLTDGPLDRVESRLLWARSSEKMQEIYALVEEHAKTQEAILDVAREVQIHESEQKRQPYPKHKKAV